MAATPPTDPVWQTARAGDRDRYLSALLTGEPARGRLMALAAFNGELERIAATSSEPQLGAIRLQWWRDAMGPIEAGEATGAPVADALGKVARGRARAVALLEGVVEAHLFDVEGGVLPDEAALAAYLENTDGALFALAAEAAEDAAGPAAAAREAGFAYGLTRLLCRLPRDLARGLLFVPRDVLARHGVEAERLIASGAAPGLEGALGEMRAKARAALESARARLDSCLPEVRRAMLPLALAGPDLRVLERAAARGGDTGGLAPPWRIARLVWAAARGGP